MTTTLNHGRRGTAGRRRGGLGGERRGVPPNAGQSAWWSHQPHSRLGLGRKSPVLMARSIAAQSASSVRSKRAARLVGGVAQHLAVGEVHQPQLGGTTPRVRQSTSA